MQIDAARAAVLLSTCLATAWGCGGSASPVEPSGAPRFVGLTVAGPAEVPVGRPVAFTATAQYADGTARDVTGDALWATLDPSVAAAAPGGRVAGVQGGETSVQAFFEGRFATRPVLALPEGTFVLSLDVVDASLPDLPILGATAELETAGGSPPPMVRAGATFKFYGVRGRVRVRVALPPLLGPTVEEIDVVGHQTTRILLPPISYTVTIAASQSCEGRIPDVARTRTYRGRVSRESFPDFGFPKPGEFLVRLEGETFDTVGGYLANAFVGALLNDSQVRFEFWDPFAWDFVPYFLIDNLSDPEWTAYRPRGYGVATSTASGMVGVWTGSLAVREQPGPLSRFCSATDHQFTMMAR